MTQGYPAARHAARRAAKHEAAIEELARAAVAAERLSRTAWACSVVHLLEFFRWMGRHAGHG